MDEYSKVIHQMLRDATAAARKDQRAYVVLGDPDNVKWCEWGLLVNYLTGLPGVRARLDDAVDTWEVTAVGNDVTVTQVKRYGAWIGGFSSPVVVADETSELRPVPKGLKQRLERTRRIFAELPEVPYTFKEEQEKIAAKVLNDYFGRVQDPHPTTLESIDFLRAERGEPTATQADEIRALRAWVRYGSGWFDDPNGEDKK